MGAEPQSGRGPVRFGVFELERAGGELRKHGVCVRLQDQPLKLLVCLLDTPGALCTREDLIRKIWPEGTFVDYDHGLNATVNRLRQVLGDSADAPRYVDTVGRKGYRFIAPVEQLSPPESIRTSQPEAAPGSPVPAHPGRLRRLWYSVALVSIGFAAGGATVWWRAMRPALQPLVRLNVELGPEMAAEGTGQSSLLALSPDGSRFVVAVTGPDAKTRLATRRLEQSQLTLLAGTDGADAPFFSPDGQWIAFFADTKLKKVSVQGGSPETLAEAPAHFPTGSWGDDGNIVAMLNPTVGLSRVPSAGGPPTTLAINLERGELVRWPQVLPGSGAVLFTSARGDFENGNIEVFLFKTGKRKTIHAGGIVGRYLPGGHLVYARQTTLFAVPFDLGRLEVMGVPQPVLEDIGCRRRGWSFDFSLTGSFLYLQHEETQVSLFWLDGGGNASRLQVAPATSFTGPRFSPDGKRLAYSMTARGHQDIWLQDLDRGTASRLTALGGLNDTPVWTADSANLIFRSQDQPNPGIYGIRADGSGQATRLLDLRSGELPSSVSPDGKRLAIYDLRGGGTIWIAPVESGHRDLSLGKAEPFLESPFNPAAPSRSAPAFSPDGRWLAYCSNESGEIEVYVVPFPGPGGKWRISIDGGKSPVWSRNGRELFFENPDSNQIMVASYKGTGDSFAAAKPRVWSGKHLLPLGQLQSFDIAPDGKRFATVLYADGTAGKPVTHLTYLLNFFDELRRRVPAQHR